MARRALVPAVLLVVLALVPRAHASGVSPALNALPFSFAPNLGQTDPRVKFLARSGGMTLFLTSTETVFVTTRCAVRMRLVGANPESEAQGVDPLPGRQHSLVGRDPSRYVTVALVRRGATARRAFVATFLVALGLTVAVERLDLDRASESPPLVASRPRADSAAAIARGIVRRQADVERYDVDLGRVVGWPLASGAARVRPTLASGGLGYQIESDLADGILAADGFTVTEPKTAAALDIASGDRIVAINGYPPAGGAFASVLWMQRDPDRNTIEVELVRNGLRMRRTIVVR